MDGDLLKSEFNVSRALAGCCVIQGVGVALGYGLGAYYLSDFGINLEEWMKKESRKKKKYYERIERMEKMLSRYPKF